jgi:oligopeptide/dipeptide ABC transporter ATP-binding protein
MSVQEQHSGTSALISGPVLRVENLSVDYPVRNGIVAAVREVSFELQPGEIMGIAGESGCGKSTLAHAICGLLRPPARVVGGSVWLTGRNVVNLTEAQWRHLRWEQIAIVPQSAMNNLSPVLRIGDQIADAILAHRRVSRIQAREQAQALLRRVGIAETYAASYPHELSGGMRQRAVIAMAIALDPAVLVLDEPTTALDVIVQASILAELRTLRDQSGFAMILITHDLPLLIQHGDRIVVMYGGRVVESATAQAIWRHPRHPYTQALLQAFPPLSGPKRRLQAIAGTPPNLRNPPVGCGFAARCPLRFERCDTERPPWLAMEGGAGVACWRSSSATDGAP